MMKPSSAMCSTSRAMPPEHGRTAPSSEERMIDASSSLMRPASRTRCERLLEGVEGGQVHRVEAGQVQVRLDGVVLAQVDTPTLVELDALVPVGGRAHGDRRGAARRDRGRGWPADAGRNPNVSSVVAVISVTGSRSPCRHPR